MAEENVEQRETVTQTVTATIIQANTFQGQAVPPTFIDLTKDSLGRASDNKEFPIIVVVELAYYAFMIFKECKNRKKLRSTLIRAACIPHGLTARKIREEYGEKIPKELPRDETMNRLVEKFGAKAQSDNEWETLFEGI